MSERTDAYKFVSTVLSHDAYLNWQKRRCEVSEPDLDDEQPVHVTVKLGVLRAYERAYRTVTK